MLQDTRLANETDFKYKVSNGNGHFGYAPSASAKLLYALALGVLIQD